MANREHVAILKQGVAVWNKWRNDNSNLIPNLRGANLSGAKLDEVNLSKSILTKAKLIEVDLVQANLKRTDLMQADFSGANLTRADLSNANLNEGNLNGAILINANLNKANLNGSDLSWAELNNANLNYASLIDANLMKTNLNKSSLLEVDLTGSNFFRANLNGANLKNSLIGSTTFADIDLSKTKGLDATIHNNPSTIGIDSIYRSRGKIPEVFLRGAGVPESMITFMKSLTQEDVIQFYTCFLSHSSKDSQFTKKLHDDLQVQGVRVWYAPEDLKIGDKTMPTIDRAIRIRDKLMIVLSENSIESNWVDREVETAEAEELATRKNILFPIRIDEAVMETEKDWAQRIRKTRHIGDFTNWKDSGAYQKAFYRLLQDLREEGSKDG